MANSYVSTGSSSLGGTAGAAGLVQKAYDRLLEFALRSEPLIRSVADKRPARQAIPGSTVVLQRYVDLAAATTALTWRTVRAQAHSAAAVPDSERARGVHQRRRDPQPASSD